MNSKFDKLVRSLEQPVLEELRRSVVAELGGRRTQTSMRLEDIHPRMSDDEKARAIERITRVLRGEDGHA
ncbi:MAG TPA: hypothetical protein VGR73_06545 [Bryobacteraceae bacterium]|nr:hypothetical protein [Bryobacteraceae bacterium]